MRHARRVVLFTYVLLAPVAFVCGAEAQPSGTAGAGEKIPLERMLNPDGSLNLHGGFSGTLDPAGFEMVTGPNGKPRFVARAISDGGTAASGCDSDAAWDDRFFPSGIGVNQVQAIAVNGATVYVGGLFVAINNLVVRGIAKWDGSSWSALGSGLTTGASNGMANALAVSGSDLYVGGSFTEAGGISASGIAKWDGSTWSNLGSGVSTAFGTAPVYTLAVSGTDVYVGGQFSTAGGVSASNIAKWDGSAWSALGSGMNSLVQALKIIGTDLYAGGGFTTAGGVSANRVAKWDGTAWSALGSGTDNTVLALATVGSDLYAAGFFGNAGGVSVNAIAKWNGSTWSALGSGLTSGGFKGTARALSVTGTDLYAVGEFNGAGGVSVNNIAKWNGTTWSALSSGIGASSFNNILSAVTASGTDVYAGGFFTRAGAVIAHNLARWDGTVWSAVGQDPVAAGVSGPLAALAVAGTEVLAGGAFRTADSITANMVASWDGTTWSALGTGIDLSPNSNVFAVAMIGTDQYVAGRFFSAGGLSLNSIARWNGSSWSALGSGLQSGGFAGNVYALAASGTDLYAGGEFTTAGGLAASNIAKWDGSTWAPLGTGINSFGVRALAVGGVSVYAGGIFTSAGGVSASNIARWDGSSWSALGSGINGTVNALAASGTEVYAGGVFSLAGGVAVNRIAKWDGSTWSALDSGVNGIVFALALHGTDLYAGGSFTEAGGVTVSYIAKWDGTAWSALGSGMNDRVSSLGSTATEIYAGGNFGTAGGKPSNSFARWSICGNCTLDAGEECDDGNQLDGDCCSSTCQHEPNGDPCTDDGNACTDDECNGTGTCTHPNNSDPCDDGLFCNGTDTCSGGTCAHAGDPCSGSECNTCQEATDSCFDPSGTVCSNDGNPCTDDVCDGAGTCGIPNTASCSDGLFCNGTDTCAGGSCTVHAGDPCPGTECNTCQEATDSCVDPAGAACTSDGNVCTDDECNGTGTCTHPNNSDPCNDGVFCNGADSCSGGTCSVHPGDPCTGGGECATGCNETADNCGVAAGTPCTDDGDPCTTDTCDGMGSCDHGDFDADGIGDLCDNCSNDANPDQSNSDCPDPSFTACGSPPPNRVGCCDGGDACDICPAEKDNTQCDPGQSTGANIGPAGGTITTPDGSVTITVPAGALASDTTISVTENGPQSLFALDRGAVVLRVSLRPENQTFAQPLTVRMRWNDRDNDGVIDFGICQGAPSAGLSCDSHSDCAPGTCSDTSQLLESQMVLRRNAARFSKNGFGVIPYECSAHLAGGGCATAAADCSDAPGTGEASVALCCDPVLNEWTFETCSFSEIILGPTAADLIPGRGSASTDCYAEWVVYNPQNAAYTDASGFPNYTQTCMDGDAICDGDGTVNGRCEFVVAVCLNLADPRLVDSQGVAACSASGAAKWEITKPRPDSGKPEDATNAVLLRDAVAELGTGTVGGGHQGTVTFSPTVTQADHCTAPVVLDVPLKSNGTREGRKTLRMRTTTDGQVNDIDKLKLVCVPSDVP